MGSQLVSHTPSRSVILKVKLNPIAKDCGKPGCPFSSLAPAALGGTHWTPRMWEVMFGSKSMQEMFTPAACLSPECFCSTQGSFCLFVHGCACGQRPQGLPPSCLDSAALWLTRAQHKNLHVVSHKGRSSHPPCRDFLEGKGGRKPGQHEIRDLQGTKWPHLHAGSVNSNGADQTQQWENETHHTPGWLLCWPKCATAVVPRALEADLPTWDFPLAWSSINISPCSREAQSGLSHPALLPQSPVAQLLLYLFCPLCEIEEDCRHLARLWKGDSIQA